MLRATRDAPSAPASSRSGTATAACRRRSTYPKPRIAYLVAVELPGVKADELEITFEDGLLTIQGERRFAHDSADEKMHRTERSYGAFRRSITLPSHVEADKIEASMQDGVLQIMVPKAPEVQAKRVQVRAGQGRTVLTQAQRSRTAAESRSRAAPAKDPTLARYLLVTAQYSGDGRGTRLALGTLSAGRGCRARLLVLTHFSQRYDSGPTPSGWPGAAMAFGGSVAAGPRPDRTQLRPGSLQRPAQPESTR